MKPTAGGLFGDFERDMSLYPTSRSKKEFFIDDLVKIKDTMKEYDTYEYWALKHNLKNWKNGYQVLRNSDPGLYKIMAKGDHRIDNIGYENIIIYGIENISVGTRRFGCQYIMGFGGLELVSKPNYLEDILFEI